MATGQRHHLLQCFPFLFDWDKVIHAKMEKLKNSSFEKHKKPLLKIGRIEQISEFCDKKNVLPKMKYSIYLLLLLKRLDINFKEQYCSLNIYFSCE